jgi:hypothetical protein
MSIVFGSSFTQLAYRWTEWKTVYAVKHFEPQFHEADGVYTIYGYDDSDVHYCQIFIGDVPYSALTSYSQEQNDADKAEFLALKENWGKQVVKKQSANKALLVAHAGREGSETIYASHNFCDPTSWFGDSVRFSEVLSGSGAVFSGTYQNWICMNRGSVLDEDGHAEDVPHGYSVVVVANGVTMSARDPLKDEGGDYVVNYESGSISFTSGTYDEGSVTASYSYENGSTFYLTPVPYKKIDIEEVESQFTLDVVLKDTIVFGIFGYVQFFAPEYWSENGGPLPTNYRVLLKTQKYRSLSQLIDEALGSYPVIPALGGAKRGLSSDMYGFPFRYGTVRTLVDSYGLEVRVWLENHVPCEGERVTATFYCVASDEV